MTVTKQKYYFTTIREEHVGRVPWETKVILRSTNWTNTLILQTSTHAD